MAEDRDSPRRKTIIIDVRKAARGHAFVVGPTPRTHLAAADSKAHGKARADLGRVVFLNESGVKATIEFPSGQSPFRKEKYSCLQSSTPQWRADLDLGGYRYEVKQYKDENEDENLDINEIAGTEGDINLSAEPMPRGDAGRTKKRQRQ